MKAGEPYSVINLIRSSSSPRVPLSGVVNAASVRRALTVSVLLLMALAILFPTGHLQDAVERMARDPGAALQQPALDDGSGGASQLSPQSAGRQR